MSEIFQNCNEEFDVRQNWGPETDSGIGLCHWSKRALLAELFNTCLSGCRTDSVLAHTRYTIADRNKYVFDCYGGGGSSECCQKASHSVKYSIDPGTLE